ncbi:hypothetical protein EEG97_09840, partial [Neisseria gonorrhoeae]
MPNPPTLPNTPPSFPRRRESRFVGAETYRIKRFLRFHVLDSRLRASFRSHPFGRRSKISR